MIEILNPTKNPLERIQTREAWACLNRGILAELNRSTPDIALQLAQFMSDLNIELHKRFGIVDEK